MKPKGRLADLAETKKNDTILLGEVQRFLLARIDQPSDRRQDILHPSEMAKADWCPRQSWYRLSGATPSDPEKKHGHQLENIFDEGHTIHDKWQRRLWDMGILWGKWGCLACEHTWEDTAPQVCPLCLAGKRLLQYLEVPIDGEEKYLIAGHEDGAVLKENALVEVKSIGQGTLRLENPGLLKDHLKETTDGKKVYDLDGIWKNLKRPLPSHLRQTAIYAALANAAGLTIDKVVFIYEYKANQSVKEFSVRYNPRIAEPLLDSALDIKYALDKGKEVPRPGDRSREHKSCQQCPFFTTCMGVDSDSSSETAAVDDTAGQQQLGSGRPRRARRRAAVCSGDRPSRATQQPRPEPADGPDGTGRLGPDQPVQRTDVVGGLPGGATGGGGGRRVRRRGQRQAAGEPVSGT